MKKNCRKESSRTMLRGLSLLLVMTTLLMLCAGCGSGSAALSSAEETTSAANSVADSVVVDAVQSEATAEVSTVEEASVDEPESIRHISYPLKGNKTISLFRAYESNMVSNLMDDYYQNKMYNTINELTGVTLKFVSPSSTSADENFSLMIASGDYTDLLNVVDGYSGGASKALEEDVIVDLTDKIEQYAPDYWNVIQSSNEYTKKEVVTPEGKILSFYGIENTHLTDSGLMIRKDWLDELGLEVPQTPQELYEVLMAFKSAYDPDYTLDISVSTNLEYIVGGFEISGIGLGGMFATENLGNYLNDNGEVVSTLQSDNYRTYLEFLNDCYVNGLIDQDYYSGLGFGVSTDDIALGQCGVFRIRSDAINTVYASAEDDNFELLALPGIVANKGDTYEFDNVPSEVGSLAASISTTCEDVELAMEYVNWFFTSESKIPVNYGTEGTSFDYDENGTPLYNDTMLNGDANLATMKFLYCFQSFLPVYLDMEGMYNVATEVEQEAIDIWSTMGASRTIPTLSYTTEEQQIRANYLTDVRTYAAEKVNAWIVGQEVLDTATWNDFQEQLTNLGLEKVLDTDRAAYQRYNS